MPKPKLNLCAAEWTFTGHPSESDEWSMDRKTQEAKEAGFAGFSAGPNPTTVQACQKSGLTLVGMVDIGSVEEVKAKLDRLLSHLDKKPPPVDVGLGASRVLCHD